MTGKTADETMKYGELTGRMYSVKRVHPAINASNLYSLIAFKEGKRKTNKENAIYGKRYLEGKYEAVLTLDRG